MKRTGLSLALLLCLTLVHAHDMWLETDSYFAKVGERVLVRNGNGTIFDKSENAVTPDRVAQYMGRGPSGGSIELEPPQVEGNWLTLGFVPQQAGNYWVGLGSRPRLIEMTAEDFKGYLEHDGLPHVVKERKEKGIQNRDEIEEYSKFVKTYLQVGDVHSQNFDDLLGLAIEIVPLRNPYELGAGQDLPLAVRFKGELLPGFLIHAGTAASGELDQAYTDESGKASIRISRGGRWFLRGIHLSQVDQENHSYESYWASLTFEVK